MRLPSEKSRGLRLIHCRPNIRDSVTPKAASFQLPLPKRKMLTAGGNPAGVSLLHFPIPRGCSLWRGAFGVRAWSTPNNCVRRRRFSPVSGVGLHTEEPIAKGLHRTALAAAAYPTSSAASARDHQRFFLVTLPGLANKSGWSRSK